MYQRAMTLRFREESDGSVHVVASTDAPCNVGGFDEVLVHEEGAVDVSGARSCLLNHKPDSIIGSIKQVRADGHQLQAVLDVLPEARTATGVSVLDAVRKGALRGVSIGYDYDWANTVRTGGGDGARTQVRVMRWSLREISLTPIPADVNAHVVRSLPGTTPELGKETHHMPSPNETAQVPAANGTEAAKTREELDALTKRVAQAEKEIKVRRLAAEHGLDAHDLDYGKPEGDLTAELLQRQAKKIASAPPPVVTVERDAKDKLFEAAVDAVLQLAPAEMRPESKDGGMRAGSFHETFRAIKRAFGESVENIGKYDRGAVIVNALRSVSAAQARADRFQLRNAGAAVTSGFFTSYVLLNAADKVIAKGFESFPVTYPSWTTPREVDDFKTFYGANLDQGDLTATTENTAFGELYKVESGYSGALSMYGAVVTLTDQAISNDDLGIFMLQLGRAGGIARRTVESAVYTALAAITWTNHGTSSGGSLAASTLDAAYKGLQAKTGPAGKILGLIPKFIIVPAGIRTTCLQLVRPAPAATAFQTYTDLEPVVTPHLTTAGTASQSTWYLVASPAQIDTVVVATLRGVSSPVMEEFDAGAVAARKWKIKFPFTCAYNTTPYFGWQAKHS